MTRSGWRRDASCLRGSDRALCETQGKAYGIALYRSEDDDLCVFDVVDGVARHAGKLGVVAAIYAAAPDRSRAYADDKLHVFADDAGEMRRGSDGLVCGHMEQAEFLSVWRCHPEAVADLEGLW